MKVHVCNLCKKPIEVLDLESGDAVYAINPESKRMGYNHTFCIEVALEPLSKEEQSLLALKN